MARADDLYGANDLGRMFPDEAPSTPSPFPHYNKRRPIDHGAVARAVGSPPTDADFVEVDPRTLRGSQPSVTRQGVSYYLGRQFQETGETFADKRDPGNKFPVVYDRQDGSERIIRSGHHRAAAALLQGQPLRMRRVQGP